MQQTYNQKSPVMVIVFTCLKAVVTHMTNCYAHDKVSAPKPATVLHVVSRHKTDAILGGSEFFHLTKRT